MALQSGGVVLGFGNEVHVCLKIFSRNFVFRTAWLKNLKFAGIKLEVQMREKFF